MARPAKTSPASAPKPLDFYGLPALGFSPQHDFSLTGDHTRDQLQIEMICFRISHRRSEGGLDKFGHFKQIVDLLWNNPDLPTMKRFVWNPWAERMLRKACDWEELSVAGPTSAGKCLDINELCLKHDGSTIRADDVKVGDLLMGDDSQPRRVLEVHRGRGPMYRIVPERGDPWAFTPDHVHVWLDTTTNDVVEMSLRDAMESNRSISDFRQIKGGERSHEPPEAFRVEPIGEGDWVGFSIDGNKRHLLGDFTVTHNSDPFALWCLVNYISDPTHVKVLMMSTTLDGAKLRIWKTFREYVDALPNLPGKPLWSTNRILGPSYDGSGTGESSGVMLLASSKSKEKDAIERLIGIKSPKTGEPDDSWEGVSARPEFADLMAKFAHDEDYLRDLLPRLVNLSDDRVGKLIVCIDEATGLAESILTAVNSNMKPGNVGSLQIIMIANPNLHFDSHGIFSAPMVGWDKLTLDDDEWETVTGGLCIRFNGEKNPRITEKNEKYNWMLTERRIKDIERDFGRDSLYYYRMVLGFWSPEGATSGVYSQAEIEANDSMKPAVWGLQKPVRLSSFDPSFTNGGDRASCTFWSLGTDIEGKKVLERNEVVTIKANINDTSVPVSYQLVRNWRRECEARGVPPQNACFDSTGGGITFGDVVKTQWSSLVHAITSAGKVSRTPVGKEKGPDGKPVLASDKFANKATELWYGAHPFLRSGQLRGITTELAKEICSRQHEKQAGDGRTIKVEGKRLFKAREGHSPDDSDSFFLGIEHAKTRHGFKPDENAAAADDRPSDPFAPTTWKHFCQKARRVSARKNLLK